MTDTSKAGQRPSAYEKALGLLARREHSSAEVRTKLRQKGYTPEEILLAVNQLTEHGQLSDDRYAEVMVRSCQSRYGARHIAAKLATKGISRTKIAVALGAVAQDELATATALWRKRYRELPADPREKARQIAFLQRRGFSFQIISKILGD